MPSKLLARAPIASTTGQHQAVAPAAARGDHPPPAGLDSERGPREARGSKRRRRAAVALSPSTLTNFFQGNFSDD